MSNYSDISVVISGPVIILTDKKNNQFNATAAACKSVKEKMPGAEVILSTWMDEDVTGIEYDQLVRSVDPGPNTNNVNRQICSRRAGILAARHNLVLAMRSESHIVSNNFLYYWNKYNSHSGGGSELRFLNKRIIIPAAVPAHRNKEWFHMGDWYYFGEKDDLIKLWDLPYMDDSKYQISYEDADDRVVYNAHRYLITSFIKKYYPLHFETKKDLTDKNREIYERVLAENFVLTGFYEYGLMSYKYPTDGGIKNRLFHLTVDYTFSEWCELYNRYCNGNVSINVSFKEKIAISIIIPIGNRIKLIYHAGRKKMSYLKKVLQKKYAK